MIHTMKLKYSIVATFALAIIGALVFVGVAEDTPPNASELSSMSPGTLGLAITRDGKTAYVPFMMDDSLLVLDLSNFTIMMSIDVSKAGIMLASGQAVLSPDDSKLYVVNHGTRNVMIINTKNNTVEKVLPIDPYYGTGDIISVSYDGTAVYITSYDRVYVVNSSDNSYHQISVPGIFFESVEPSVSNPDLLYCIGRFPAPQRAFFTFNLSSSAVERASNLTNEALPPDTPPMRFTVNSDETTAYFGSFKTVEDKGVGKFNVFDLSSFQILLSTPIECGISDFAINEETDQIYIIGFWAGGSAPNTGYIREWDMSTNSVTREIFVSPSNDQRAIAIDPADSNYLYMTEDINFIRKVEIPTGKEVQKLHFSKEEIQPISLIRGDSIGYIACSGSDDIYKLNLSSGQLMGSIPKPYGAPRGVLGYYQHRLYFIVDRRHIYSANPSDGSLIETFDIGININPIKLTFFDDKMATINYTGGAMIGKQLLLLDSKNMTVLKSINLPSEPHGDRVIASPDGSKLYIARGPMDGPTVITIFNASTLEVINTVEIPHGATGASDGDFDETNRILYLCGFNSIYKINMDTDELIGILDVWDVYQLGNTSGWPIGGLTGVVLSYTRDKLFVISGDAHCMYTYDLVNSSWTTKITNLKGYTPTSASYSPDRKYLYTVNPKSDSITMVDLTSEDVVKITTLPSPLPIRVCAAFWENVQYLVPIRSNSSISDFVFNQTLAQISFNATGESGTAGYCNVTIPNNLLWGEFTVLIDGNPPLELIRKENATYISLYFTYELQSTMTVQITGTEVIPEFPSFLILPLFLVATLLAVIFYRTTPKIKP